MASDDLSDIQATIKKQANAAVFGGVVGLIFAGIIFGPGAMIRGSKAKKLILAHDTGQEYLTFEPDMRHTELRTHQVGLEGNSQG